MDLIFALNTAAQSGDGQTQSPYTMLLIMGGIFLVMYFVMIRPQKKRQKEEQEMRETIEVGDEITTIGGIIGRVLTVKEESLIIETGADRVKMKMARWCVSTNNTAQEKLKAEREAQQSALEKERAAKAESKKKGKKQ
ncbi:MAG: preprotein translocase subunit YajC [Oscillospiraceae bacterium]|nr:preprotein translocase subunit YajC [Oscillospiraceae bacterium]